MPVVLALFGSVAFGRNAVRYAALLQGIQNFIRVVAFVTQKGLKFDAVKVGRAQEQSASFPPLSLKRMGFPAAPTEHRSKQLYPLCCLALKCNNTIGSLIQQKGSLNEDTL
jgi:hypothetical protein